MCKLRYAAARAPFGRGRERAPAGACGSGLRYHGTDGRMGSGPGSDRSADGRRGYFCPPLIACLVLSLVKSAFKYAEAALSAQTKLTELLFPIMFSVTLIAGDFGVALIKPFTVFLGFFTGELILDFFLPLLSLAFCVLVVGNLSDKLNLNELFKTLMSVFKWSIGFIAAIYSSLITVEGLCNGTYNGVSVKILKYLSGTSVPIVGGLISGSTDVILSAVTLVKNSIGVMSAVVIICYVGLKGVNSVAYSLSLKFLNSLLAPVTNSRITKLINGSCEIISALAALIFKRAYVYTNRYFRNKVNRRLILKSAHKTCRVNI